MDSTYLQQQTSFLGDLLHPKILPQFDFLQNYQAEAHSIHGAIVHLPIINQPFNAGKYAIVPWIPWGPWRIIPVSKWLIYLGFFPFQMAFSWLIIGGWPTAY